MRTRVFEVDPATVRVRSLMPVSSGHIVDASERSPHRFVTPFSRAVCCRSRVSMTMVSPIVIVCVRSSVCPVVVLVRLAEVAGPVMVHTGWGGRGGALRGVLVWGAQRGGGGPARHRGGCAFFPLFEQKGRAARPPTPC